VKDCDRAMEELHGSSRGRVRNCELAMKKILLGCQFLGVDNG
jgi:hypothetical protein